MQQNTTQDTVQQAALDDVAALMGTLELPYLLALQGKLAIHVRARQDDQVAEAREKIRKLAADVGMTYDELMNFEGKKTKTAKTELPARYRHPETGETWSGLGRRPGWVHDWITSGKHLLQLSVTQ
jgi:DNA-binding protein H-NS